MTNMRLTGKVVSRSVCVACAILAAMEASAAGTEAVQNHAVVHLVH